MGVPGYEAFMLPLLKLAADGKEHTIADAMETLASQMGISIEDQELFVPSGVQTQFYNRVTWAVTYLTKSLLLARIGRGRFRIAPRGVEELGKNPSNIDTHFLERFSEYREFKTKRAQDAAATKAVKYATPLPNDAEATPPERLQGAFKELRDTLADDLQERVRSASPKFFEHLVVCLLIAMGYGGGQVDRAEVTGKSGDEGIDGVIREDRLGLDMIYVQAKKWDNSVGPGEIDRFVGSLSRKKATKGVFITSGTFTDGALGAAREATVKVRLIDGDELAELMIDFNVGVADAEHYVVKKLDGDFFEEMA